MAPIVSFDSTDWMPEGRADDSVIAAVARVREWAQENDEQLTTSAVFDVLKLEPAFSHLTLAQVKMAEKRLGGGSRIPIGTALFAGLSDAVNQTGDEDDEEDVPGFKRYGHEPRTHVSACRARGGGLEEATVRQASYFWIEACDQKGRKRTSGGDTFVVSIRGPSQCRARVTDNSDGTYLVVWKPHVSGVYSIAVSLFGDLLPGAPFTVSATNNMPCSTKCSVRGEALHVAVSRAPQNFEILFRDRWGQVSDFALTLRALLSHSLCLYPMRPHFQVAKAVDIDVFVEPLPPSSPRHRIEKTPKVDSGPAAAEAVNADADLVREKKERRRADRKADRRDRVGFGRRITPAVSAAAANDSSTQESAATVAVHEELTGIEQEGNSDEKVRSRTIRVKVKDRPLIVRSGYEKDTKQVGVLLPGQVVTVVEERLPESGEVRAMVALDSVARAIDGLTPSGGSVGESASTFRRKGGEVSSRLLTGDLSARGGHGGGSSVSARGMGSSSLSARGANGSGVKLSARGSAGKGSALSARAGTSNAHSGNGASVIRSTRSIGGAPGAPRGSGSNTNSVIGCSDSAVSADPGSPVVTSSPHSDVQAGEISASICATDPAESPADAPAESDREKQSTSPRVGWVTLVKSGQKLVSSRVKLGPGSRRQYFGQWARRKLHDKTENASGHLAKTIMHELTSDPSGIGFGFGGVEPGVLHAQGKLHEAHKVSYSIGMRPCSED